MALTGFPDRAPLGPPAGLVSGLDHLARPLPGLDPLALLVERAAWAGFGREGDRTCGGAGHLLRAADGWLAVSLPRPDDVELVPAWLANTDRARAPQASPGSPVPGSPTDASWDTVARAVRRRPVAELEDRAALLGMAVAGLGRAPAREPVLRTRYAVAPTPRKVGRDLVVLDLSALWAGPLCGALLGESGATVIKIESTARPDGARRGPRGFFDRLNGSKASVALDLDEPDGARSLRHLIERADMIVESSRPRALRHLGIDPAMVLTDPATRPRVWVSITAHGRAGDPCRIGFGDDAAVAGGLVSGDPDLPLFCADAIADPCTGLTAAGACLEAVAQGGRWLLDVALSAVAASLAGPTLAVPAGTVAHPPVAPPIGRRAPEIGIDTGAVLSALEAT